MHHVCKSNPTKTLKNGIQPIVIIVIVVDAVYTDHDCNICKQPQQKRNEQHHVLLAMSDSRAAHTKANQSGLYADARHVHCALPDRILFGAKAVHDLQPRLFDRRLSHLL